MLRTAIVVAATLMLAGGAGRMGSSQGAPRPQETGRRSPVHARWLAASNRPACSRRGHPGSMGRATHLRAVRGGPVLRPGLRHRAGPSVADGDVAADGAKGVSPRCSVPPRSRETGRRGCCDTAGQPTTAELHDLPSGRPPHHDGVRRGRERVHRRDRTHRAPAGGVRPDRHPAGTVDGRDPAPPADHVRRCDVGTAARPERRAARRGRSQPPAQPGSVGGPDDPGGARREAASARRSWPRRGWRRCRESNRAATTGS